MSMETWFYGAVGGAAALAIGIGTAIYDMYRHIRYLERSARLRDRSYDEFTYFEVGGHPVTGIPAVPLPRNREGWVNAGWIVKSLPGHGPQRGYVVFEDLDDALRWATDYADPYTDAVLPLYYASEDLAREGAADVHATHKGVTP